MRYFIFLCLSFAAALPAQDAPRLVNLADTSCLLAPDDHGKVSLTCWESNGVPAAIPYFKKPISVSAAGPDFCVSDAGRVRCWGYGRYHEEDERPLNRAFAAFENVRQLSINAARSICFVYGENRVGCVDPSYGDDAALKHPPALGLVTELAAGEGFACALQTDGKIACWGSEIPKLSQPRADLKNPRALQLTRDKVGCVLSEYQLRCWGDTEKEVARLEGFGAKVGHPLLDYVLIAPTDNRERQTLGLLATDLDGNVWWVSDKTAKAQALTVAGFHQNILVAGDDFYMFAANRDSIVPVESPCVGCDFEADMPFYHRLRVPFPVLPLLESFLRDSRANTYAEKARIFSAAQELLPMTDDEERWFVLGSLRPLIEENDSAFMQEKVVPRYKIALEDLPHSALREFHRTPSLDKVIAKLLHAALVSSNEEPWRPLALPLGQWLATDGENDRRELVAIYRRHASAFAAVAANPRYAPLVHFVDALINALAD